MKRNMMALFLMPYVILVLMTSGILTNSGSTFSRIRIMLDTYPKAVDTPPSTQQGQPTPEPSQQADQAQSGKTWHTAETWTVSLKTPPDNPSQAETKQPMEPSQDDGDSNSRPATADRKPRKRKVKKSLKLKTLLFLILASEYYRFISFADSAEQTTAIGLGSWT